MAAGNRPITTQSLHTKQLRAAKPAASGGRVCVGLFSAWLLTACTPSPESMWQDYRDRLQRVLDQPLKLEYEPASRALPVLTAAGFATKQPAPTTPTLSLLEVEQTRACGLDQLAAERNSQLGKVMTPSVRLHYELRLLSLLPSCIALPALSTALREKLQLIYQQKTRDIYPAFQYMLAADATIRSQLQGSLRGIRSGAVSSTADEQGLRQLVQLRQYIKQEQYTQASQLDVNAALALLYSSQLMADVQPGLNASLVSVRQLNDQLEQIDVERLCRADATIRDNVLQTIFIEKIQPELAALDGISSRLEMLLNELYQDHPLLPEIQQRYQDRRLALQQQLQRHVQFWQRWRQCGR